MAKVKKRYKINFDDYYIVIYHPVTTELQKLRHNAKTLFGALKATKLNYVCIYPNNDKGADVIIEELKKLKWKPPVC